MEYEGLFEVVESFAIERRKQFYLLGRVTEGRIEKHWYVSIPLNSSMSMSVEIAEVEEVQLASESGSYTLLIADYSKVDEVEFLLMFNVGLEKLQILKSVQQ